MLQLNATGTPQEDVYANIKQQRQELALRILLNNLAADFKSAGTASQQDSIRSQIDRLVSSMGEGKSFSDVTGQDLTGGNIAGGITGGVHGSKNKVAGRSEADYQRDKTIIKDLEEEFADKLGVKNTGSGDTKDWAIAAAKSDDVNFYDIKTGEMLDGKKDTVQKTIIEFKSEKYGTVKIQVGGDGELNGNDDKVIEIGGKAAAQSMEGGLNNINSLGGKAEAGEAKALTAAPQVAQLAQTNPVLGQMLDQVQDPNNLTDSNIKDLIAAIMLLIGKQEA